MLAPKEIYTNFSNSYDTSTDLTRQLDYYAVQGVTVNSNSGAIKKNGTSASYWWLRAADSNNSDTFSVASTYGVLGIGSTDTMNGASPAFRIG